MCLYTCMWAYACECSTLGVQKRVSDTLSWSYRSVSCQCGFRKRTPISLPLSHASSPIMLLDYWTLGSLSSAAEEALSHWKLMAQGQSTFSEHIFFSYCNQTYFINLQVQDLSWLISEQTLDCNFIFSWKFYKTFYAKLSNFLTTALPWSWDYCDKCLLVW